MAENEGYIEEQEEEKILNETTMDVTDKKCPNCGATVTYDPATLAMTCEFCGYSRTIPRPESNSALEEIDFETAKIRANKDWGTKQKSIVCKMCGAESLYDEAMTAGVCPFCGSTSVMPVDSDEDIMAPGGVVPFEIPKEKAAQLFKTWLGHKIFTPSAAKKSCEADSFTGIYLPYWTYDSETTSSYDAQLGFEYKVKTQDGYETKVRWRRYTGIYEEFIDDQVVYASTKTKNPSIKAVSVFDFTKLKPYSPEYISGFAAERYTLGLDDGWTEAKGYIQSTLKSHLGSKLRSTYKADRVGTIKLSTAYDKVTFKYLLAPIWMSSFKFNGKVYNFVVNGQTGKVAGKAPISALRVAIAIILGIIAFIIVMSILNS
jgi:ribosomal protein S27E